MSSTSLFAFNASFLRFVSSRRSSEDEMSLLANDSRNYGNVAISSIHSAKAPRSSTYHLKLVLPELLLLGLI